jgi:hypothetical protein
LKQFDALSTIIERGCYKKRIKDSFRKEINLSEGGGTNELIEIYKDVEGNKTIAVKDYGQGPNEYEGSCFYRVMAKILFNDENRYMDIRYFFYYLYTAFSMMDANSEVFQYDKHVNGVNDAGKTEAENEADRKEWNGLQDLLNQLVSLFEERIWEFYVKDEEVQNKYKLVKVRKLITEMQQAKENSSGYLCRPDIQHIFQALGSANIDIQFWGGDLEFTLLRSIFNIRPTTVEVIADQKTKDEEGLRRWSANVNEATGKISFIYKFFKDRFPEVPVFLGRIESTHFVLLSPLEEELIDSSAEAEDEASYQALYDATMSNTFSSEKNFVREWLGDRRGKLLHRNRSTNIGDESTKIIIKKCFKDEIFSKLHYNRIWLLFMHNYLIQWNTGTAVMMTIFMMEC